MCVKFIADIQYYVICVGMDVGIKSLLLLKKINICKFSLEYQLFLQKAISFSKFSGL